MTLNLQGLTISKQHPRIPKPVPNACIVNEGLQVDVKAVIQSLDRPVVSGQLSVVSG
jgi:hypothetical protein